MLTTIEAIIGSDGQVHLNETVKISGPCRAIVVILDEPGFNDAALLSEDALGIDWNRPEEDEAWAHLYPAQ